MDINPFQFLISRKKTLNQINFFSNFLKEKTFVKNKKEKRKKKQPIAGTQTQQLTADKRKKRKKNPFQVRVPQFTILKP